MSDSLWPRGLQYTRLPCPSPSLGVCSNLCPLSWRCHPTISFSVTTFSFCPQSFPTSGSFPMSQLFTSGGQSIGPSSSTSVLPANIQGLFPLGLTGLLSLQSKGCSRVLPQFKSINVQDTTFWGFSGGSEGKDFACNEGNLGLIPGWGDPLKKKMATHSSILAWRVPWKEEPGRL